MKTITIALFGFSEGERGFGMLCLADRLSSGRALHVNNRIRLGESSRVSFLDREAEVELGPTTRTSKATNLVDLQNTVTLHKPELLLVDDYYFFGGKGKGVHLRPEAIFNIRQFYVGYLLIGVPANKDQAEEATHVLRADVNYFVKNTAGVMVIEHIKT